MTDTLSVKAVKGAPFSARFLGVAAAFWLTLALLGQWAFTYYLAAFYGGSVMAGDFEIWNRLTALGAHAPYVAGDTAGNSTYAAHALAATIIAFGGALQLLPFIRNRWPVFHRWNGRLFLLTVVGLSLSGFYLVWVRRQNPDVANALPITLNGVLILSFAGLAYMAARARNFTAHRRWAMRLYLVSNAQWFLRVGVAAYFVICMLAGRKPNGALFMLLWSVGCYAVPLAVLQLYFHARESGRRIVHVATSLVLITLTLIMGVGIFAFAIISQSLITGQRFSGF